jgi:hypothetical protein
LTIMRKTVLLILILALCCSNEKTPMERPDRFLDSLHHASEISTMERLTQDGRCIFPMFAPGDTIIYFRRLLAPNNEAASGKENKDLIKPFGINIKTRELLTLSSDYTYPEVTYADNKKTPSVGGETVTVGILSPDSAVTAFETVSGGNDLKSKIYIQRGDHLSQLTYGDISCYLERFSNSGRYLSALLDWDPSWILIFDLKSNNEYVIERQTDLIDYMTYFSSDDKMMVFIRSDGSYTADQLVFGDIWLVRFNP